MEKKNFHIQVIFTQTDAILLKDNLRPIKAKYLVLTNPLIVDKNSPSKYWKVGKNNSVVVMDHKEQSVRDKYIQKFGIDGDDIFLPIKELGKPVSMPCDLPVWNTPPSKDNSESLVSGNAIEEHYLLIRFLVLAFIIVIGLQLYVIFR